MELIPVKPVQSNGSVNHEYLSFETSTDAEEKASTEKPFIQANTIDIPFQTIKQEHIIPVYIKDNEPLISHADFIEATLEVAHDIFSTETILSPSIRLSHPVKGRIPEAKNKPAAQLFDHEKTIYFERMAFIIEVPTIYDTIDDNTLSLTLGGVKAYSLDNLSNKKGSGEHFKIFIGFQNRVCTNLCVYSDGYYGDLKVNGIGQLKACIKSLFETYNYSLHLHGMNRLTEYALTEQQFALLMGRCKMYQYLNKSLQNQIQPLLFGENQLATICKDYYRDNSFCKDDVGNINLWRLYNLFTNANKSTYIDNFIDKSVNAFDFVYDIKTALDNQTTSWFLN